MATEEAGAGGMYTLEHLAKLVSGRLEGDGTTPIHGVAPVAEAGPGRITFATDSNTLAAAKRSQAAAVIIAEDAPSLDKPVIRTANPRLAFSRVLELFAFSPLTPAGIAPDAHIAEDASVGTGVAVGPRAHIGPGTTIGDNAVVHPGVYVGADVVIGENTVLHPGVVVLDRVHIGSRVLLHPGVVVGVDGFGFVPADGRHHKVPHIGSVAIGDDVEIGANAIVARATMGATTIGRGTKIDGLVFVAHNVKLGEDVIIVGHSAVAGGATVEDGVTLAGQTGVAGHLTIGAGAIVGARGLVLGDVEAGQFVSGSPARAHRESLRVTAATHRLPELLRTVSQLEARVAELEARLSEDGEDGDGEDVH